MRRSSKNSGRSKIVLPDFYSLVFRRYAAVTAFLRPVPTGTALAQTKILDRSCVWAWTRPRLAKTTKNKLIQTLLQLAGLCSEMT